ncbi:translation factor GTPase family protein [uncultured Traorella sp.]|uniref:translation factor GTPase family protein n=1 Tax=uncultured Traorella sp. TaxID=1929048 RepID=UPI0034377A67
MVLIKAGSQGKYYKEFEKTLFSFLIQYYNVHMNHQVIGILAHVDAGKTTLSESLLYLTGAIRKKGRVDHQDAFLDYDPQERDRGITIFSKQARFSWKNTRFTLIDTPGHVDFSSEMERSLSVLDAAILVINGCDGGQSHTETIWRILMHYQRPVFIFVNKMDISYLTKEKLMEDLHRLDMRITDVTLSMEEAVEQMATSSDEMLQKYMAHEIDDTDIQQEIVSLHLFGCVFGSALKGDQVERLLDILDAYTIKKTYPRQFGARVFKITHEDHKKWVHMKITGGSLKVKEKINDEKADQIRLYSGDRFESVQSVDAGEICAVSGLNSLQIYDSLGYEKTSHAPLLTSYMKYRLLLPKACDVVGMVRNLKMLSEEDPQLMVSYDEESKQIYLQVMGEVQIEILKNLIFERFSVPVEFDQGSVIFKETITEAVEGVGHFEPLRHYAEVHLLLEPLKRGEGLVFENRCSEDVLAKNWQRLIMTHLEEKVHRGVLSGSAITDMKITLLTGKAHPKHTEGGDFREATYRAVRQGLRSTTCLLLEPYYAFRLMLPAHVLSRAIFDIEKMHGTFQVEDNQGEMSVLSGKAPVRLMRNYQLEVLNYTKGRGKLICSLAGYEECVDQDEVVASIGYDCDRDTENPCGSVFCRNGAGFFVPYDKVEEYMHIKKVFRSDADKYRPYQPRKVDEEEVLRVYERTYGKVETRLYRPSNRRDDEEKIDIKKEVKKACLLVDGYNIIHAWEELALLAKDNLDAARSRLIDLLSSYQGYRKCLLILVFDAYKVKDNIGSMTYNGSIYIVYTKTAQTADAYIEKATHEMSQDYLVQVATSDSLEQLIISGQRALRISAREFEKEVAYVCETGLKEYESKQGRSGHRMLEGLRKVNEEE